MSVSGNLGQHPEVHYAPFEIGGSGARSARRPEPKDELAFVAALIGETDQHLQRSHALLARLRQAVRGEH